MRNLVFLHDYFNLQNVNYLTLQDHMYSLKLSICVNRNSRITACIILTLWHFSLYMRDHTQNKTWIMLYKACYDILFTYAGPHALYNFVCSIDYFITNAGPYAKYSGYWTWLYLFCYAGPYAFYFRFMSSVLTDHMY